MARGPKPKPLHLRVIEGSLRPARHGQPAKVKDAAKKHRAAFGPLEKPKYLKGEAGRVWDRLIAPATWLDGSRGAAAIALCQLYAEFLEAPRVFPAAKHGQMRGLQSDLGLTDERRRAEPIDPPQDEFFED